ncbi:hypothetical protein TNCV_2003522 [Trichonephila clavipes]|nr:hypothetical protein TNCV_2003522 [Trichonephila clavipes]
MVRRKLNVRTVRTSTITSLAIRGYFHPFIKRFVRSLVMVVEITWLLVRSGIKCFLTGLEVSLRLAIASALERIEAHEIHRGKGLEVRLSLALSTIQVTVRISSAKFPEETIDGDTTYLHLHNLGVELNGREIFFSPCTRDSTHKTFGPTDLTSTYSVCTRRVFGGIGIEPRPSGLESDALTTRLPTATAVLIQYRMTFSDAIGWINHFCEQEILIVLLSMIKKSPIPL